MSKKKDVVMTWNHRVVRRVQHGIGGRETTFAIHEVYSMNGRPDSVTVNPVPATSESLAGLRETLQRMLRAVAKPILEYEGFKKGGYQAPKRSGKKREKGK